MVVDSLRGGLGAAISTGSHWLHEHGWDVVVVAPDDVGHAEVAGTTAYVDIPESGRQLRRAVAAGREIERVLTTHRPDLVHCHGLRSFFLTRVVAGRRALLTVHQNLAAGAVDDDPRGYHLVRRAAVTLLPRLALRAFSAAPGVPGRYEFAPHASPRLARFGQLPPPPDDGPILWIGRLDIPKLPLDFVRAVVSAGRAVPGLKALIVGAGPLEHDVVACIERLDAPVECLGERSDIVELLGQARAVVLFSLGEAVPFALSEAMWAGRAVIASRLPGTEWLRDGPSSGVTLVDDVDEAAAAIVGLSEPGVATDAGNAAAVRIRSILSVDSPWPNVERAYRAVLARA
jgi:glycosyltransferase involved in cell wall biosynthesis